MRRHIITLVLSLTIAYLYGNDNIPNPHLFLKKVYFPVIETPACFTSTVHGKDFLVFVEYSDSLNMRGHYMALEEGMTLFLSDWKPINAMPDFITTAKRKPSDRVSYPWTAYTRKAMHD